jgi:hypothetical protein
LIDPSDDSTYGVWEGEICRSALKKVEVTLLTGTILECDRVYIRNFNKSADNDENDFNSITWRVLKPNGKPKRNQRFWAKLKDCNEIEFDLEIDSLFRNRVKKVRQVLES